MKKVSPLLSILFLVVAAGMLAIRVTLPHCPFQLKSDTPFGGNVKLSLFNETLLRYASIDLTELKLKQEIEGLLQGNFPSDARQRSFLSSVRDKRLDVKTMSARRNKRLDVKGMSARGIPMEHLSPEFRPVWLRFQRHLQDWSRKRKFQDDIMMDLIKIVKGLNGESIGLERKYRSCAVVGNSGILLKNGYGESIDNHEVVIRLNNAKLRRYENNVGKKTSISFVNSNILHSCARRENCFCHPYGTHVPIAMYICQPAHFLDYIKCSSSHKAPLIVTDPRFDVLCARIVKYYSMKRFISLTGKDFEDWIPAHDGMAFHYSSGMQAVMLAVGVCDKVSIFGFGKSGDAKHHYHTNQKSELGLHDYEAEYDLYRDLVSSPEAIPFISDKFKFPSVSVYH